jgi:hypothetical protein
VRGAAAARGVRADVHAQRGRVRKLLGQLDQSGGSERQWTLGVVSPR